MNSQLEIRLLSTKDPVPYHLLLLADPSKELVDGYLTDSFILVATLNEETVGICVLQKQENGSAEIKNIAVKLAHQGKGIATLLLKQIIEKAKLEGIEKISIGTGNSSIAQLYLYQKVGFEIDSIKKNFFKKKYPEPISENGIECNHMIMLSMNLSA